MPYDTTFTEPDDVEAWQEAGERVAELYQMRLLMTRLMENLAWFGRPDGHEHTFPTANPGDGHPIIIPGRDAPNLDHDLAPIWYLPEGH